jgi:hypothetical protein
MSLRHFGYVYREPRPRQQRCQLEHFEAIASNFGLAIDSWFGVTGLVAALEIVEKLLGLLNADFSTFGTSYNCLGRIRADEFRPIPLE